jgi:2-methylcitrate dehydratase PrpD
MSLSQRLVDAACAAAAAGLPAEVDRSARLHLLDSLGVGLLAAHRGPLQGLERLAVGRPGPATVLGRAEGAAPEVAALVNGTFVHSLEYDDTHVASVMHGSATLTPAALAAAEESGAGGADLVAAYAVGWEVLVRMGLASPGTLQARGFQTTSAAGPFAAALVAVLLQGAVGHGVGHGVDALGIAGSQPGGTFAFLADGDTVKAAQPAWAAHSGLWAAALARAGVTGPAAVLDGPHGFYRLYADDPAAPEALERELGDLGERWHLPEAAFKLIPACHFIHPFVEALERVLAAGVAPADVAGIRCHVPTGAAPIIASDWPTRQVPPRAHLGRWSLPYTLAGRLVDGTVDLELYARPVDAAHTDVARRVTAEPWEGSGFPARFPARIVVTTTGGEVHDVVVDDVIGGAGRPVPEADVLAKLERNLTGAGLGPGTADELVALVLEGGDFDVARLGALLRTPAGR